MVHDLCYSENPYVLVLGPYVMFRIKVEECCAVHDFCYSENPTGSIGNLWPFDYDIFQWQLSCVIWSSLLMLKMRNENI